MVWLRLTLYDLYHLSARITGVSHHAQSIQCWAGTQGFRYNRQANTLNHFPASILLLKAEFEEQDSEPRVFHCDVSVSIAL